MDTPLRYRNIDKYISHHWQTYALELHVVLVVVRFPHLSHDHLVRLVYFLLRFGSLLFSFGFFLELLYVLDDLWDERIVVLVVRVLFFD